MKSVSYIIDQELLSCVIFFTVVASLRLLPLVANEKSAFSEIISCKANELLVMLLFPW